MPRLAKYVLLLGFVFGIGAGIAVYFMATGHNPQRVYTDHPEDLWTLVFIWVACVSFPFTVLATLLSIFKK